MNKLFSTTQEQESLLIQAASDLGRLHSAQFWKLLQRAYKGYWGNQTVEHALKRFKEEILELEDAIQYGTPLDVLYEAADCANYLAIIVARFTDSYTQKSLVQNLSTDQQETPG